MDGAAQFRRCGGAPRASLPLLHAPSPKISNRESVRLEIDLTHTKQTTDSHSNREDNACFSGRIRAVNRLCDCRAIDSARRNRVRADDSARGYTDQPAKTNPPEPQIRTTRRGSITEFNKRFRKRSKKAPSLRVSVRKKSSGRFQQLTQILIERMFRLEIPPGRRTTERETAFGHRQEGESCHRMYGASRGMLAPVCCGTRRGV
jgi:hypothetical protein